jgi:hypothetical protein
MNRRNFLKFATQGAAALATLPLLARPATEGMETADEETKITFEPLDYEKVFLATFSELEYEATQHHEGDTVIYSFGYILPYHQSRWAGLGKFWINRWKARSKTRPNTGSYREPT